MLQIGHMGTAHVLQPVIETKTLGPPSGSPLGADSSGYQTETPSATHETLAHGTCTCKCSHFFSYPYVLVMLISYPYVLVMLMKMMLTEATR